MQGQIQTKPTEIINAFQQYYTQLFTAEETNEEIQNNFLKFTKQLSEEKETLHMDITLADIPHLLITMQKNKTPGPDGLTVEFYQHFFPILGPLLLKVFQDTYDRQLPHSCNLSYMTLIPKENADKTLLKNYRPISLLNTDYKI